jgi:hypothetical protein
MIQHTGLEIQTELAAARKFMYRTSGYEHMVEYGEQSADPFYAELFTCAYPKAKAFNDIMTAYSGRPEGIEFKHISEDRYAYVAPDSAEPGKFRVQYFDKGGFSSHFTCGTRESALEEMVGDRYLVENIGILDQFAVTREFQRGNEVSALIGQLNMKKIDHAEFAQLRDAIYAT